MQTSLVMGGRSGPTRQYQLDAQRTLKLPALISDQISMTAFFRAPTSEAKKILPSKKLRLVEVMPGTTLVGIACTEYRVVEGLAAYNEVGIMVPVRYAPRFDVPVLPIMAPKLFPDAGYYFHRMPLTSPDALDLGLKMYGLRKLLADIRFEDEPYVRRCSVTIDGAPLLTLEVKKGKTRKTQMTTQTYTVLDGKVLKTPVPSSGRMSMSRGERAARLTLGTHYIADEIRALKLSREPMIAMYGAPMQSVLCAPDRVLLG